MSDKDSYTRSKPWRLGGLRELPMRDANRDLEVPLLFLVFLRASVRMRCTPQVDAMVAFRSGDLSWLVRDPQWRRFS